MMGTPTLISVEQFAAMPRDEAVLYELVEGELVEVSSATARHAWIRDELRGAIRNFLGRTMSGIVLTEVDCRTVGQTVRRPDISFLSSERWAIVDEDRLPLPFAPDIAGEILSPTERAVDVNRKIAEYLAAGSREVWIIDPANLQVSIHTVTGARLLISGDKIESLLLPGFSVGVAEALAGPKPLVQ
jgi:Uma2 family endonuclease